MKKKKNKLYRAQLTARKFTLAENRASTKHTGKRPHSHKSIHHLSSEQKERKYYQVIMNASVQ